MSSLSLPNYLVDDTSLQRWHRNCSWRKGRPAWVGVHAMDGQSGDGAREGETLGKGGSHPESEALGTGGSRPESSTLGKGGSDAHSDKSADDSSVAGGGAYQATRLPKHLA